MIPWVGLNSRALIAITGPERIDLLQGLVTQKISEKEPCFSAILTPQGRFFTDFFVVHTEKQLLLDCAKIHHGPLLKLLMPYSLLHDASLHDWSTHYGVCAAMGEQAGSLMRESPFYDDRDLGAIFYTDPRHPSMGVRALVPYSIWNEIPHLFLDQSPESAYHNHRIGLGIPEGAYDLIHQHSVILEYGYQHIHAISWEKGCYMGQELMARTFHRGVLRKHLYRITLVEGVFPPSGTELSANGDDAPSSAPEHQRVGWMGGHCGLYGLAALHQCVRNPEKPLEPILLYSGHSNSGHSNLQSFSVLLDLV
jgi:hypothetical protein